MDEVLRSPDFSKYSFTDTEEEQRHKYQRGATTNCHPVLCPVLCLKRTLPPHISVSLVEIMEMLGVGRKLHFTLWTIAQDLCMNDHTGLNQNHLSSHLSLVRSAAIQEFKQFLARVWKGRSNVGALTGHTVLEGYPFVDHLGIRRTVH